MIFNSKTLIVITGFLVVFLTLIVFVIIPFFQQIGVRSDTFFSVRRELLSLEEKAKKLPFAQKEYSGLKLDREKVENLFISSENPLGFLESLETAAGQANISIAISLLPQKEEETSSCFNFQLTLTGSFSNCLKFLEKLETLSYLITVEKINFMRLSESQLKSEEYQAFSLGDVRFDLSIKVLTNGGL